MDILEVNSKVEVSHALSRTIENILCKDQRTFNHAFANI